MKRGIVLFLAVVLLFVFPTVGAVDAPQTEGEMDEELRIARAMLDGVTGLQLLEGEIQSTVSRGEFVDQVLKLFRLEMTWDTGEAAFRDVGQTHAYFGAVQTAVSLGMISGGENFEPDRAITLPEALKILLSAAGYQTMADWQGGYPVGYLSVAASLKLTKNVTATGDANITRADGVHLFYNLLSAKTFEIAEIGESTVYESGRQDYLSLLYDMYWYDGIVTATSYNSLLMEGPNEASQWIAIDGERCRYGLLEADMLGKYVRTACTKAQGELKVVCVCPMKNQELTIRARDLSKIEANRATYLEIESGDEKRLSLDAGYITIYNGRRVAKLEEDMLYDAGSTIRFLDNDRDDTYEIVFVDQYRYGIVSTVDFVGGTIGLRDNKQQQAAQAISLGDAEGFSTVQESDGSSLELFELAQGDVVAVRQSKDLALTQVIRCGDSVFGTITAINKDLDTIEIDGETFYLTEYFKEQYLESLSPGAPGTFTLGINRALVSADAQSAGFSYGFLTQVKAKSGVSSMLQMKIFEESGQFAIYDPAERISLDGGAFVESEALLRSLWGDGSSLTPQMVRFCVNGDGKIYKLDLAAEGGDDTFGQPRADEDALVGYSFGGQSLMYKSNVQSFPGYCNVSRSIIFKIPTDLSDEDNFSIWRAGSLTNDQRYAIVAYNLDQNGYAGAVLLRSDEKGVTSSTSSMMVEKVVGATDENGETGYRVYCWTPGGYVDYFLNPSTVPVQKISGEMLCCGDIIRANVDAAGQIRDLIVDFDAQDAVFSPNTQKGGATFNGGNATLMYQEGGLYSVGDSMLYLSNVIKEEGAITGDGENAFKQLPTYDYSFQNLRNFKLGGSMVLCNRERKTVRPITAAELKSYIGYGQEEHYVVLRQNAYNAVCLFVYE